MGVAFVALICVFAIFAVVYLYLNDFAKETMEIVFPAIGAILFSSYLAAKTIWIDAPAPDSFVASIALFQTKDGILHGVPCETSEFARTREPIRGSQIIDSLAKTNEFKSLWPSQKVLDNDTAGHVLEYAILSWLSLPDLAPGAGWRHDPPLIRITGGGGGGSQGTDSLTVGTGSMASNELLKNRPLTLALPQHSSVERAESRPPGFVIHTPMSTLSVSGLATTFEVIKPAETESELKLHRAITADPETLLGGTLSVHTLKFTFHQAAFTRFSNRAKAEAEWFAYIRAQFAKDFSWEQFRHEALVAP